MNPSTNPDIDAEIRRYLANHGWQDIETVDPAFVDRVHEDVLKSGEPLTPRAIQRACQRQLSRTWHLGCLSADRSVQDIVCRHMSVYMQRIALRVSHDEYISEEAAQNTFISVFNALGKTRDPAALMNLCEVSVIRETFRLLKNANEDSAAKVEIDGRGTRADQEAEQEMSEQIVDPHAFFEVEVDDADQERSFWACLLECDGVTYREKLIVFGLIKLGLSHSQVAQKLHVARNALDQAWHRARSKLKRDQGFRQCLADAEYGERA